MNYQEAIDYIYSFLPAYQNQARIRRMDLDKIRQLCQGLGDPQKSFQSIHITGTNGKGSTSHALSAILQTAGYKIGLYTSPHLKSLRERIRIDGVAVDESYIARFINQYKYLIEAINPSYFDINVAMAYKTFADEQIDIAVVEVGMGGRLDATNIITPILSLITNVSCDHMEILGDSLQAIACEKAGIIKPAVPVIIGTYHPETMLVFEKVANGCQALLEIASTKYQVKLKQQQAQNLVVDLYKNQELWLQNIYFNLGGMYQCHNIPAILNAIELLITQGFAITEEHIRIGLAHIQSLTNLQGRWQILSQAPLTIGDTGHNIAAIEQIVQQLRDLPYKHLHIVWGMSPRKDWLDILQLLPKKATYYFCQASVYKSINAYVLTKAATDLGLQGTAIPAVSSAYQYAKNCANRADLIFIGGSTYIVAEII